MPTRRARGVDALPPTHRLAWLVPLTLNGGTITDYVVQYRAGTTGTWLTFADGVSTTASATVTGLTTGTSYRFSVVAVTGFGSSSAAVVTPSTKPGMLLCLVKGCGRIHVAVNLAGDVALEGAANLLVRAAVGSTTLNVFSCRGVVGHSRQRD